MLGCIKLLLVAALVVSCLAAGNSTPKTSKPQPQKPAKSNSHGKAVAFALRQTANEPEVPAVRFLLAGCGPQYNTLSAKQRNIFDKTLHNAVVKFQMAQKMKPADGVFGPGTMEKAIQCQPVRAGNAKKMWSVHALQTLLNKNGKRFPAPSDGVFDDKTQESLKKFNKAYLGKNDADVSAGTWRALFSADPSKPLPTFRPKPVPKPNPNKPNPGNPNTKPKVGPNVGPKPTDQAVVPKEKCTCMGAPFTAPTWTADAQTGTISVRRWAANPKVLVNFAVCAPLVSLCLAANEAKLPFPIISGYRTFEEQRVLHQRACGHDPNCDKEERPGTSVFHGGASIEFDLQGAGCESPLFQWLATTARKFGFLRSNQHRQSEWTWFSNPPSQVPFSPMASCEQKPNAAPAVNTDQLPVDDPLFPTDNDQVADFDTNSEIAA